MKNRSACLCVWVMSLVLVAGCGPEGGEAPPLVDEVAPQAIPSEYLEPDDSSEQGGAVEGLAICCYVKCSGNRYGPFPKVQFDLCAQYGRYYCPQRRLVYQGSFWKNC
ncbi:hypothetical protein NVS55_12390 [Myxococcus stipitatus]|uniref:hypothetical protein n=1 Tax=Myxococcus stipitatus TaxID=83455 RepID=UPI0031454AED